MVRPVLYSLSLAWAPGDLVMSTSSTAQMIAPANSLLNSLVSDPLGLDHALRHQPLQGLVEDAFAAVFGAVEEEVRGRLEGIAEGAGDPARR